MGHFYRYAKTVNIIFNQVLFVQFFCSILVLCTSIYSLAHITEIGDTTLVLYTICMFIQIYFYCWSGNEVILMVNNCLYSGIYLKFKKLRWKSMKWHIWNNTRKIYIHTYDTVDNVVNCETIIVICIVLCWQSTNTSHAIYHTDWPLLSISEKKDLLMIMMRSTRPIKLTSSFLITLSLDSYSNVSIIASVTKYIFMWDLLKEI